MWEFVDHWMITPGYSWVEIEEGLPGMHEIRNSLAWQINDNWQVELVGGLTFEEQVLSMWSVGGGLGFSW